MAIKKLSDFLELVKDLDPETTEIVLPIEDYDKVIVSMDVVTSYSKDKKGVSVEKKLVIHPGYDD